MELQKSRVGVVGRVGEPGIVGRLEDRGIVGFDDAARFPRENRKRRRHGLRGAVRADDAEGQFVRRTVELLEAEHESWIAVFNKRAARSHNNQNQVSP